MSHYTLRVPYNKALWKRWEDPPGAFWVQTFGVLPGEGLKEAKAYACGFWGMTRLPAGTRFEPEPNCRCKDCRRARK